MNDPDISNGLRRIVPDDLSAAGLVDGARRKRRRKNGAVGAVGALALVALAVPVGLSLQDTTMIAQPATAPTPSMTGATTGRDGSPALPGPSACYNDDGTPVSWDDGDAAPAEPGAVKAWLCGDYSPETGQGVIGPLEPLTSGLDQIIADVQSKETIDLAVTACTADYNLSFNAVFEYPDGTRRIIGGERHGCRVTYDGGVTRVGGEEFYGALYSAWQEQRATDTGDWVVPHVCPGPLSLMEMDGGDAVQASVCGENPDGSWSASYLGEDLLTEVRDSLTAMEEGADEENPQPTSDAPEQRVWLTLSNEFTDYKSLVRHEDGLYQVRDGEGLDWFWAPAADLSARLDEALASADPVDAPLRNPGWAGTGPTEPSVTADPGPPVDAAQPFVPDGCRDASSGALVATALPGGAIPEGAERVWLCANGPAGLGAPAPPLEPLTEPGLTSQAAAAFNDLAPLPADQPCTMELGPSYLVVHEYADGARHAVELQEYGCRAVNAGDVVKGNSELYKEQLLELWSQQRKQEGTTQTRPGPLCPLTDSMFVLVASDVEATSGTACRASTVDDAAAPAEVPLAPEVVGLIVDGVAAAPLDPVEGVPSGDSVVLLTRAGDPFVLFRLEDGTFYWPEGEYARLWTPTGEAAERLAEIFPN